MVQIQWRILMTFIIQLPLDQIIREFMVLFLIYNTEDEQLLQQLQYQLFQSHAGYLAHFVWCFQCKSCLKMLIHLIIKPPPRELPQLQLAYHHVLDHNQAISFLEPFFIYSDIIIQINQTMLSQTNNQNKLLLDRMRAAYTDVKTYYVQFLNSLRYQNIGERKKFKNKIRRVQDIEGDEGWENNITKHFSFEQEMIVQNNGYIVFLKLIDSLKKLQVINNEIELKAIISGNIQTNRSQVKNMIDFIQTIQKNVPGIINFNPSSSSKEKIK